MAGGETLVGGEARLFERMGERVMADVMEQRGELDLQLLGHTAGKMVRTQRVLKPGVCGPRVNEKCVTELPDVPQTLERRRVDDRERLRLEADVVPERGARPPAGGARFIAGVLFRSRRCPTPYGPPVQPVLTSQHRTSCRAMRSPSILA